MEKLYSKDEYCSLIKEFKNENRRLIRDLDKLTYIVFENIHVGIENAIGAAIALHRFDLDNMSSEYSNDLKLSIVTQKPLLFNERVHELCLIISALDEMPTRWVTSSVLALHKSRIENNDFRELPDPLKDKSS